MNDDVLKIGRIRVRFLLLIFLIITLSFFLIRPDPLMEGIAFSNVYFSREGGLLGMYPSRDDQYRHYAHISSFPQKFLSLMLVQEDRYFYYHPGVNPFSLLNAFYQTYIKRVRKIGGSTITMQLARMYYGLDTSDIPGKISQIGHALFLELFYSKQDIFEAYLNMAPCGGNIQGFPAAALIYFNRSIDRLNFDETAMLAILPQDPLGRDPRREGNRGEIIEARDILYGRWKLVHPDTEDMIFHPELFPNLARPLSYKIPHLTEMLKQLYPDELTVTTSIDWDLQEEVESLLEHHIVQNGEKGVRNGAALILDYRSMELLAMVGSVDFFNESIEGMVNGVNSRRSPGSTLKPFIYGQALDQGRIHSNTILYDRPVSFSAYAPENFSRDFSGPVPAWRALINSRNIPAVELNSQLGYPDLYDLMEMVQVGDLKDKEHYGLSIVLGSAEVSMLELAGLYAALGNNGMVSDILAGDGLAVQTFSNTSVMSPQAARIVRRMLERNPPPDAELEEVFDGWIVLGDGVPVAYKTGTSIGFKDAWSIGLYGPYVIAVWIGNFDGMGNSAFLGRSIAAPLFFNLTLVLEDRAKMFYLPYVDGVRTVDVCSVSGDLPGEFCSYLKPTLFIPGVSPITTCQVHRPVWVAEDTGLRVRSSRPDTRLIVREVWPSDLLKLFKEAGIPRPVPPPFEETGLALRGRHGLQAPAIISPVSNATYILRPDEDRYGSIPLMGSADGEVNTIYWFANGRFLGQSEPQKTLIWTPLPGEYELILLDDRGLSRERGVIVQMEP